jgi:cell division transport system permease protein
MTTTLIRILKFGFQNFARNGLLSATTVAILVLALLVFNGLLAFGVVANSAVGSLQDKIDISVYFKSGVAEDKIFELERALEELSEVKGVEYVSQEKALTIFKEQHDGDAVITQALDELQANPLLASLNVKAKDPNQYPTIAGYLETANLSEIIEKVTYAQNKVAIDRLASIVNTLRSAGLATALFLALVAILVTFNTIRLAIYSNREEIGIMRLVGASNKFINGPYIVTGIIYGVLAGTIGGLIALPLILVVSPHVNVFIPELSLSAYLAGNVPYFILYQFGFGIGMGAISAAIAVRRYLKI